MTDRRQKKRFPLVTIVRYKLKDRKLSIAGVGQTINISSSGVLLHTQHAAQARERVELAIAFPLQAGTVSVELIAQGSVVRVEGT